MFTPRGFYTSNGYVGVLPDGSRIMFATYDEYLDYMLGARNRVPWRI